MSRIKLLLISPNAKANQTRKIRQGFLLSNSCESVQTLAFDRSEEKYVDFEYESLGVVRKKRYFSRIPLLLGAIRKSALAIANADVVFTWTLDTLCLTIFSKILSGNRNVKIIYNVRDVHPVLTGKGVFSGLLRRVDKISSRFVNLFVFTSPAYENYYKKILRLPKIEWIALENKVPEELWSNVSRDRENSEKHAKPIIGYFGVMSYQNSWEIIKRAGMLGAKFYMRGHNYLGESFLSDLKDAKNIIYEGSYKNPEDLGSIFSKIDISWAINSQNYKPKTNDQWAMCNRFYEGLYFKKPLIVQEGSAHSLFVKKNDIGLVVDARNREETAKKISSITSLDVERWKQNIEKIDNSVFMMNRAEYARILEKV